jgi:hypothetical protein
MVLNVLLTSEDVPLFHGRFIEVHVCLGLTRILPSESRIDATQSTPSLYNCTEFQIAGNLSGTVMLRTWLLFGYFFKVLHAFSGAS